MPALPELFLPAAALVALGLAAALDFGRFLTSAAGSAVVKAGSYGRKVRSAVEQAGGGSGAVLTLGEAFGGFAFSAAEAGRRDRSVSHRGCRGRGEGASNTTQPADAAE